eukprot:gene10503-7292_t
MWSLQAFVDPTFAIGVAPAAEHIFSFVGRIAIIRDSSSTSVGAWDALSPLSLKIPLRPALKGAGAPPRIRASKGTYWAVSVVREGQQTPRHSRKEEDQKVSKQKSIKKQKKKKIAATNSLPELQLMGGSYTSISVDKQLQKTLNISPPKYPLHSSRQALDDECMCHRSLHRGCVTYIYIYNSIYDYIVWNK